jgi:D-alanine-D-alanine ligase
MSATTPVQQDVDPDQRDWWERVVRRKGYIGPGALLLLAVVACVPLVMAFARLLALPGIYIPEPLGGDAFRALGSLLNQSLSLEWVPPSAQWAILYILLLPTSALLIALARLTFGLRVLGFRSILVAVGFQQIGILPSLLLMAVVVATIFAVRPTMRRIRLPLYARVSVILCIAALIMVGAVLLGPWLRSDMLWSFAFFPIIILAMLAEGIADTLDRDNALTAAWRAGWTIVLALLIAFISQVPVVRELALRCPELIVTQLVAIIFISEFLDFRLLQHWPKGSAAAVPDAVRPGRLKVAVVQNRSNTGVIGQLGVQAPAKSRTKSVQLVVDALREEGFAAEAFEGDMSLLHELRDFLPPDPQSGGPGGLVLNLAAGVQGQGRSCHLPAILEMSGVAYTGPNPVIHARVLDRYVLMTLLQHAGISTPQFKLMSSPLDDPGDLRFPLAVRPRCDPDQARTIVKNRRALHDVVQHVMRSQAQDAVIEAVVKGREIRVSLLGNETVECLPLLEVNSAGKVCPAPVDGAIADRIRKCARDAYAAVGCRDYARVDVRLTESGKPQVIGVHSVSLFARNGSFARSAEEAGYSFRELMRRVVEAAWARYDAKPAMRMTPSNAVKLALVPRPDRRVAAR